ncbi:hypothetical protein ACOME3_004340 [Neoechinorhynchus agilis]
MPSKTDKEQNKVNLDSPLFTNLIGKDGKIVEKLAKDLKYVCLYFSAHWCPPCKTLTPKLVTFYESYHESKSFEIIFISADQGKKQFENYFDSMPWLALDFESESKDNILSEYSVNSIPRLIIIDINAKEVVCQDAQSYVAKDPEGEKFPWNQV